MQKSLESNLYNPYFSHIYIEEEAYNYEITKCILKHFKASEIINIDHYKDVFCRGHQNFSEEKKSPSLILAVKKDNLIYKGSPMCNDFGNDNFYYTSSMMNCIYNCEYCYLKGMYPSAHIVVFVNIDDIIKATEKILMEKSIYLCISYDTDILAIEGILHYGQKWLDFASKHKNLKIELRTKSTGFNQIISNKPLDNIILAWTISPEEIIHRFEHKTPALDFRLKSIKAALESGFKVRLCIDPLLYIKNFEEIYENFIKYIAAKIPIENVYDISIGVFRVSKEYMKIMRKVDKCSLLLNYPFETKNGICSYDDELTKKMTSFVKDQLKKYINEDKIYIY